MSMCGTCGGFYNERCPHWPNCAPVAVARLDDTSACLPPVPPAPPWRRGATAITHAFAAPWPQSAQPWTEARVVALLAHMRAAESFTQDSLLGESVQAIEWLMKERGSC